MFSRTTARRQFSRLLALLSCAALLSVSSVSFAAAKLSPEDLEKKNEGWYPSGLPLVNASSDAGVGYGVRLYMYDNGTKADDHFDSTPYFTRLYGQFFQTTKGQAFHELNLDMPYAFGSEWRLTGNFMYAEVLSANYFGLGADAADAGLSDATATGYDTLLDYESFLDTNDADGNSNRKFNNYQRQRIYTRWTASREVTDWLEVVGGLELGKVNITDWSGTEFANGEETLMAAQTRFGRDREELIGADGGWTNLLVLGVKFDERDFEPNPKSGVMAEYFLELSGAYVGSSYNYIRQSLAARGFYTLFDRLTLAGRLSFTYTTEDAPFYEKSSMTFFEGRRDALGGIRTARGYLQERFIANGISLLQAEMRYTIGDTLIFGQRFGLQPFAFADVGNVYDTLGDMFTKPRLGDAKLSYGGGLVIPWNLSTLIHVFMGYSDEGSSMSINFMHAF